MFLDRYVFLLYRIILSELLWVKPNHRECMCVVCYLPVCVELICVVEQV